MRRGGIGCNRARATMARMPHAALESSVLLVRKKAVDR